jgi:hypothetical protein
MFDRSYVRNRGSESEESTMSAITFGSPVMTAPRTTARPRLRITRRGRAVLAVLIAVPLAVAGVVGGIGAVGAAADRTPAHVAYEYVSVAPGESLWQLAGEIAPSADPRDVVADITRLNNLQGVLQPGQRIAIPPQYATK